MAGFFFCEHRLADVAVHAGAHARTHAGVHACMRAAAATTPTPAATRADGGLAGACGGRAAAFVRNQWRLDHLACLVFHLARYSGAPPTTITAAAAAAHARARTNRSRGEWGVRLLLGRAGLPIRAVEGVQVPLPPFFSRALSLSDVLDVGAHTATGLLVLGPLAFFAALTAAELLRAALRLDAAHHHA
eukprot:scaffold431_cov315-Prasinococcus_capsulatus_cf.AAC.10